MTRRTIAPILILLVVLVLALTTGFPMLFRVAYALALALIAGLVLARLRLSGLSARMADGESRTEAGRTHEHEIAISNRDRFPKRDIEVALLGEGAVESNWNVNVPQGIPGVSIIKAQVRFDRRGLHRFGPVKLRTTDPFGFFRFERTSGRPVDVIVHPATVPLPGFRIPATERTGDLTARCPGIAATLQAASVREYADGDSLNRVHWPLSAHHGRLMVKEFDASRSSRLWVVLDLDRRVQAGNQTDSTDEVAISAAASIVRQVARVGLPVGLVGYGHKRIYVPPRRGAAQVGRILDDLALAHASGVQSLENVLIEEERAIVRQDALLIISPSIDVRWVRLVAGAAHRHAATCIVVIDPNGFGRQVDTAPFFGEISRQRIPFSVVRGQQTLAGSLGNWSTSSGRRSVDNQGVAGE